MKFSCKFAIVGLLIILSSNEINPSNAEIITRKVEETALKHLQELMKFIPDPAGKVLSTVSGVFFSFYTTVQDANNKTVTPPPNDNFLSAQKQQERFDRVEILIQTESQRVIDEIVSVIVGEKIVDGLQKKINFFKGFYDDRLTKCLLNPSCSSVFEKFDKDELLDRNKDYRKGLKAFVEDSVAIRSDTNSVRKLKSIFDYIVDQHLSSKKKNNDCNNNESEHEKIFNLSMVLMAVIAKSYSVVMAAHLRSYKEAIAQKNDKHAADYMTSAMDRMNEYQSDIKAVLIASHKAFNATSRDIRTCDPSEHIRNKTWERLTKLVIAERVECRRGGIKVFDHPNILYMPKTEITPLKMICHPLKKYDNANTAYRNLSDPERKFHHFAYEKEAFWTSDMYAAEEWGKAGDEKVKKSLKRIYIEKHAETDQHMCWVDQEDQKDSIRKFSTKNVTASPGFVITGVKWLIKNKTVYMEIQEGKYVNGSIDSSTIKWKTTPEDYTQTATFNISHRSISLNDVILPPNAVLTGVQFEFVEGVIFLRAEGLETNINGDQLTDKKISVSSTYLDAKFAVKHGDVDVSELASTKVQHQILRDAKNHYLPFQPTSFEKDASQTMIPYLDIQPVFTTPPRPMGGIGIYYKSMDGYGGFAGIKLITADVTHKLNETLIDNVFNQVNNIFKSYLGYDGPTSIQPSYK